jgi:poly(hydroxyalkanoate) depolymerase family esterase
MHTKRPTWPLLLPAVVAAGLAALVPAPAAAGQLEVRSFARRPYDGSQDRRYQVFVPSSHSPTGAPMPMVMVLHGCQQDETNMINETRFRDLAERDGFLVVYPFITAWDQVNESRFRNCWGFWFPQHIRQGAGEVEDLRQIAGEVEAAFRVDPNRRYAVGLSSGAAMSVALGVAHSEYFAAVGAVAGLAYGETSASVNPAVFNRCSFQATFNPVPATVAAMRAQQTRPEEQRPVPIMLVHSRNDCTVNVRASENIRDSWLARYGVDASGGGAAAASCTAEGVACEHRRYGPAQRSVVETVFYEGRRGDSLGTGAHYWVGDNSGQFANPTGPSASDLLWAFFRAHPFAERPPPTVAITAAAASGTALTVSGTAAAAPGGSVAQVAVRLEGRAPQPQRVAAGTASWSVTFDGLPDNTAYVPVVTVTGGDGATATVAGAPVVVGTLPPNAAPTAAIAAVSVSGNCVTVSGTASDPEGALAGVEVQLGTRPFRPASVGGSGGYRYEECGLPAGSYAIRAEAIDGLGARSAPAVGPSATVSDLEAATADWQAHMAQGRLRVYLPPCGSVGFGACDAGFHQIFLAHQASPFALFRRPASNDWYIDPQNVR